MFITATLRVPQDVNRLKLLSEIFPEDNRVHLIPFFSSDTVWGILPFDSVWQGFNTIWKYESLVVGIPRLSSGMPNKSVASLSIAYTSLANSLKEYNVANEGSGNAAVVQGSRDHCQ
jgi:hypothetical protein